MDPLIWALVLLAVGLALAVTEVFIPSGGVLGVMCTVAIVTAIVLAFRHGPWTGLSFLATAVLAAPVLVAAALHVWPKTPLGRRLLLQGPTSEDVLPDDDHRRKLKALVGAIGEATTAMLPSGVIVVAGEQIDAMSEGVAIDAGQRVKIIEVRGSRAVVRPVADQIAPAAHDDTLAQAIEELGVDPFRDPLT